MDLPDDITLRFEAREAGADLALQTLSGEERTQIEGFGSERRRREFALGRLVARELLSAQLAVEHAAVPLCVAADGAPEVDGSGLHLSISHVATDTQTLAVAAVAPRRIGVDLERIQPRRPDLYRFLLAPEDYGLLDALPYTHDEAQVLIWTLKEAVLKALRMGFRLSPKKLRLTVDSEAQRAHVALGDGETWALRYDERDGCFLAVAFEG